MLMAAATYSRHAAPIFHDEIMISTIRIQDLEIKTIIGINSEERENPQEIVINVCLEYDADSAIQTDDIKDALDYKTLTKKIIHEVKNTRFMLLEKLTKFVLDIVMDFPQAQYARVSVGKPMALRFSKTVSCELATDRREL